MNWFTEMATNLGESYERTVSERVNSLGLRGIIINGPLLDGWLGAYNERGTSPFYGLYETVQRPLDPIEPGCALGGVLISWGSFEDCLRIETRFHRMALQGQNTDVEWY